MLTYLNKENKPIIRRCGNCVHFNLISAIERTGYCKQMPMLFAFTGEQTVFGITKTFYYCDDHEMTNEDFLTASAGFNWDFNSENIPKVRYIKIVSIKNWAGDQCISISEIQVYKAK